jgi:hypothetical protein
MPRGLNLGLPPRYVCKGEAFRKQPFIRSGTNLPRFGSNLSGSFGCTMTCNMTKNNVISSPSASFRPPTVFEMAAEPPWSRRRPRLGCSRKTQILGGQNHAILRLIGKDVGLIPGRSELIQGLTLACDSQRGCFYRASKGLRPTGRYSWLHRPPDT